jgi:hypothetical protein
MMDDITRNPSDRGLHETFLLSMAVLFIAFHLGFPSTTFINLGDRSDRCYVHNFHDPEQRVFPFGWTRQSSIISVPITIRLAAAAARPQSA